MTSPEGRFRSVALASPIAVLLLVGAAVPANAVISIFGSSSIRGDSANDFISVSCAGGVLQASGVTGGPCSSLESIGVTPNAGDDTVILDGVTAADFPELLGVSVNVVDGAVADADHVTGSPVGDVIRGDYRDVLNGGDGSDSITGGGSVSGGLGDDTIAEFHGDGTPTGGPGDDRFIQFLRPGGVEGGSGFDSYEMDLDRSGAVLGSDLTIRPGPDTLRVISGLDDATRPLGGIELLDFTLLRGDAQTWDGAAFGGLQRVRGMAGVDTIIGGALEDTLWGGGDNDSITGGAGIDELKGGDGNDTIQARDGIADRIDCGAGTDTVVADAFDVVAGCESVQVPPVVAPPVPPVVVPPVAVAPETSAIKGKRKVTKPRKAKFRFSSPTPGATFECKVDRGKWKKCSSTYKIKTKKLKPGKHTLRVRARVGDMVDSTPSKRTFKVKRRR